MRNTVYELLLLQIRRMAYVRLGFRFENELVYETSLQYLYPTLSERCLNVVLTSFQRAYFECWFKVV